MAIFLRIVLLVCFVILCDAFSFTTQTVTNSASLTKKLKKVNSTISTILSSTFLTKATRGFASQDPTIRNLMVAAYNIPLDGLMCIGTNSENISMLALSGAVTTENMTAAYVSACPSYSSSITSVMNAATAFETKYSTTTPAFFATFPTSFQNLISNATAVYATLSADTGAASNKPLLTQSFTNLVNQYNAIQSADRKAVAKKVKWLGPFILGNGKYKTVVANTLALLNTSIATGTYDSATLSPKVTTLAKGLTTTLPGILKWIVDKINGLTVSTAIKSDADVTSIASTVSQMASIYGPMLVGMDQVQSYLTTLVSGQYTLTL